MCKLGYQEFTLASEAFVTGSPNGDVCSGINDSASGERGVMAAARRLLAN